MRIRQFSSIVGALVFAAPFALATASSASAAPQPHPNIAAHAAGPNAAKVSCKAYIDKPFYLRMNGPLYAQIQFGTCSTPPPEECNRTIALAKAGPYGSYLVTPKKSTGWGPCAGAPYDVSYKCQSTATSTFWSEGSLAVLGGTSSVGDSPSLTTNCS